MIRHITTVAAALLVSLTLSAQPMASDAVEVRGHLIDVRTVNSKEGFFPQYDKSAPDQDIVGLLGEGRRYAVSLAEYRGPEQLRCGRSERCLIALDCEYGLPDGWESTGEDFVIAGVRYFIFERRKVRTGEWIDIPYPEGCAHSAVVFGTNITVADTGEGSDYGTVICKVPVLRKKNAFNQTVTMLPDGSYLAACTMGLTTGPKMFLSTDKGATWKEHGEFDVRKNKISNYHSLFVHRGALYFIGVGPDRQGLRICRSTDGGRTWTKAVDSKSGIILEGLYHTAPVPVAICDGRIWRGCETYPEKEPFLISAPEDSDLLDASNWVRTNIVGPGSEMVDGFKMTGSLIEGNAVVSPEGKVVNLIRTNSLFTSNYATILHADGVDSLYFDPEKDWVRMPGGGKKFTVRFDPESGLYWSLTNPDDEKATYTHMGIERKKGLSHSLIRNKLVLICSPDLIHWKECRTVLYDPDPFFHGFQYADWVFDGEDIAAVVRVGAPESRGLPNRQHDSNMMTFIKVENFRELAR